MLGKRGLGPTRHVGRWKSGRALVALVFMALPLLLSRPALAGSATVYSTMNYTEW